MTYTSRSDFPATLPSKKTFYCWNCKATTVHKQGTEHITYKCASCNAASDRVLIYDPIMAQYFDDQDRLVHESCGVFLQNTEGKLLLFKRTKFPFLLTIPAGHAEVNEDISACAVRELQEEVGIVAENLTEIFDGIIEGDACLGGADIHHWHAYRTVIANDYTVTLDEEGSAWKWYSLSDLTIENTVQPVMYLLNELSVQKILQQ